MIIFIVPYRDRENQKDFFYRHMTKHVLKEMKEEKDYKILFIHQNDKRPFNRGGMKNIGFLVVKKLYPKEWKEITLVFNDIDTMPFKENYLNYRVKEGEIKHFYGLNVALGGIVSVTGKDFEKINGFPNYWSWGGEDNLLEYRAKINKIKINRDNFHKFFDKNILSIHHGEERIISKRISSMVELDEVDGIKTISNLEYKIENNMVNVNNFTSKYEVKLKEKELESVNIGKIKPRLNLNPVSMTTIMKRNRDY